jgi:hypothetical protein
MHNGVLTCSHLLRKKHAPLRSNHMIQKRKSFCLHSVVDIGIMMCSCKSSFMVEFDWFFGQLANPSSDLRSFCKVYNRHIRVGDL